MNNRQVQRIYRDFTPEERERWLQAVAEEEAALPEHLAELDRLRAAMEEPGLSGEIRRAIAASRLGIYAVAEQSSTPLDALNAFMSGEAPLDTDAATRIAAVLDCHLSTACIPAREQ